MSVGGFGCSPVSEMVTLVGSSVLNIAVPVGIWAGIFQFSCSFHSPNAEPPPTPDHVASWAWMVKAPRHSPASSAATSPIGRRLLVGRFLQIVLKNKLTSSKVALCRRRRDWWNRENCSSVAFMVKAAIAGEYRNSSKKLQKA